MEYFLNTHEVPDSYYSFRTIKGAVTAFDELDYLNDFYPGSENVIEIFMDLT